MPLGRAFHLYGAPIDDERRTGLLAELGAATAARDENETVRLLSLVRCLETFELTWEELARDDTPAPKPRAKRARKAKAADPPAEE